MLMGFRNLSYMATARSYVVFLCPSAFVTRSSPAEADPAAFIAISTAPFVFAASAEGCVTDTSRASGRTRTRRPASIAASVVPLPKNSCAHSFLALLWILTKYLNMASVNTQFSIAVHVLTAIAHYESNFTSEVLAGSVNANPVFVKRILVKLSKAKLVKTTVGKSGGYGLARAPKSISLFDLYTAVSAPSAFAIHGYAKSKGCVVSGNIKEVMGEVLTGTQKAIESDLKRTTVADVVAKIRKRVR